MGTPPVPIVALMPAAAYTGLPPPKVPFDAGAVCNAQVRPSRPDVAVPILSLKGASESPEKKTRRPPPGPPTRSTRGLSPRLGATMRLGPLTVRAFADRALWKRLGGPDPGVRLQATCSTPSDVRSNPISSPPVTPPPKPVTCVQVPGGPACAVTALRPKPVTARQRQ